MLESKVKDLLGRNLMETNDIERAFSVTLRDISLDVLNSTLSENVEISPADLRIVKESIEAKSRMVEVAVINLGNEQIFIPGGTPEAFLEIYRQFIKITQFLRDNFNNLRFGNRISRERVAETLANISGPTGNRLREIEAEGGGVVDMAEMAAVSGMFSFAIQLILGEELYQKFGDEVNSADVILKKIRNKFGPPTDIESQGRSKPN